MSDNEQENATTTPLSFSQIVSETVEEAKQDEATEVTHSEDGHSTHEPVNEQTSVQQAVSADDRSLDELKAEEQDIQSKIAARKAKERDAVIAQIKSVVETYDIPVRELVDALGGLKRKRKSGYTYKAKYRDPETGKTWSGQGNVPVWLRDKNREDYLIQE